MTIKELIDFIKERGTEADKRGLHNKSDFDLRTIAQRIVSESRLRLYALNRKKGNAVKDSELS